MFRCAGLAIALVKPLGGLHSLIAFNRPGLGLSFSVHIGYVGSVIALRIGRSSGGGGMLVWERNAY